MVPVFASHSLFTVESTKALNAAVAPLHNTCNTQNNNDATECLMSSLGEDLQRQIQVRHKDKMLCTDIFMMFISIGQPQNAKLHDSCEPRALNMQVLDHPGANIVKMTEFSQSNIIAMIHRNAWDRKNNIALTQPLTEAGGEGNHERTLPMPSF